MNQSKGESNVPSVTIRRVVKATPEELFAYWINPVLLMQWMTPYPGEVHCDAEADVRVGGRFRLSMQGSDNECVITGEYVEVSPPGRLAFTWSGPPTNGHTTFVSVEFRPLSDATEMILTHDKLPTSQMREGHEVGWANSFDHLIRAIELSSLRCSAVTDIQ